MVRKSELPFPPDPIKPDMGDEIREFVGDAPKRSMYYPHRAVYAPVEGDCMTRQEFAADCDVNTIMARFEKTGMFPMDQNPRRYLDLTGVPDFHAAMQLMIDADAAFMSLPATVRREFDNDPEKFVQFAEDKDNLGKMREWGLAPPAEEVAVPPPSVSKEPKAKEPKAE